VNGRNLVLSSKKKKQMISVRLFTVKISPSTVLMNLNRKICYKSPAKKQHALLTMHAALTHDILVEHFCALLSSCGS